MTIRDGRTVEGGKEAEAKLIPWLQKQLEGIDVEGDVMIVLSQKTKEGGEPEVDEFPHALDEDISDLADQIIETAERDALTYRRRTRYCVRLKGKAQYLAFSLDVPLIDEDEEDEDLEEHEHAVNKKGLIGMGMGHTQAFAKIAISAVKDGRAAAERRMQALEQENSELRRTITQNFKLYQELLDQKQQRDIAYREFENQEQRKEMALGVFMKAGSMLLPKLMGADAATMMGAGGLTPVEQMVSTFVQTLERDPQKLQRLISALDPLDQEMLMQMHQAVAAKREAAEQAVMQGEPPQQNGQANGYYPGPNGAGVPPR